MQFFFLYLLNMIMLIQINYIDLSEDSEGEGSSVVGWLAHHVSFRRNHFFLIHHGGILHVTTSTNHHQSIHLYLPQQIVSPFHVFSRKKSLNY